MCYQADDADTKKRVTYVIKQGPTEFFSIDPKTGIIRTTRGLDYERENQHILIVGTMENSGNTPGATTRVIVNVEVRKHQIAAFKIFINDFVGLRPVFGLA